MENFDAKAELILREIDAINRGYKNLVNKILKRHEVCGDYDFSINYILSIGSSFVGSEKTIYKGCYNKTAFDEAEKISGDSNSGKERQREIFVD